MMPFDIETIKNDLELNKLPRQTKSVSKCNLTPKGDHLGMA